MPGVNFTNHLAQLSNGLVRVVWRKSCNSFSPTELLPTLPGQIIFTLYTTLPTPGGGNIRPESKKVAFLNEIWPASHK
jgi:hypothetical protein